MPQNQSHFFPQGITKASGASFATPSAYTRADSSPKRVSSSVVSLPHKSLSPFHWFWGTSQLNEQLQNEVQLGGKFSINSLIVGESGTGKEIVAREIHRHRALNMGLEPEDLNFLAVNCSAIPESLAESILFGHERGAFTSAREKQNGKFEQAATGTLFLDEIQNLSLSTQAKLLRVLQFGEIDRLGSKKATQIQCKVIAACNVPLEVLVEKGLFRSDLYYRLNVLAIYLPSLQERMEDLPSFTEHFLSKISKMYKIENLKLSFLAQKYLEDHRWPGNLRELEHALLYAALRCKNSTIEGYDLPITIREKKPLFMNYDKWSTLKTFH